MNNTTTKENMAWDFIIDNEITTESELQLVTTLMGFNYEVFNKVIYARTGFHSIKQLFECCTDEFYFSDTIQENIEDLD